MADLSTVFTGIRFDNPFLLASAPPTESDANIMRAFDAGWGGVVCKTIGLHPVVNVKGPKTKFLRADNGNSRLSMNRRPDTTLMASWNWELISDKPLDWWIGRLSKIKKAYPNKVLVASIMAGSGNDKELHNWQMLTRAMQDEGCDAVELNFSCPHMDRVDMGSNVGKDKVLCSVVTQAVKEVARIPVWVKLTPATANIVEEAEACFRGGADAVSSTNTFPSLPLIDPETLEFEMNVEGQVSPGGLGGPAILPLSLAKMAQLTKAFPDKAFSGIGGISTFDHALSYFLLGCGTAQVCTAAMLDHAVGPNVIRELLAGMTAFLDKNASRGWKSLAGFRGLRRERIVPHSQIKRPDQAGYHGGYEEEHEGYAKPEVPLASTERR
ncbi:MAG TPA: NAD-dependent dihydropyrimidine dehydrogenase subunit PreA [Thermoanaerobaculia bacterium]|nr:NAD-dependent dihydropyrimidine dehydrogenase subunit PreA [Thermoanaerobaculia bacterium]